MCSLKSGIIIIAAVFLFTVSGCGYADGKVNVNAMETLDTVFREYDGDYAIYVNKKEFLLSLYDKNLNKIFSYKIGYGLNPDKKPKLHAGDKRTPEGIYKITEILSMDADKTTYAYKKLRNMNSVYFKAKDGHYKFGNKNADLGSNAYGPRFFRLSYPNKNDISNYHTAVNKGLIPDSGGRMPSAGSGIAIHGNNDANSIGELASSGCIRMYNEDIIELSRYVELNMPVIISFD
ncbi:MAG: L,D-transpeptidase [Spirochaetes bacterium]|nr:L,D-transpeptidase [Spirochaetota bacterium]